MELAIIINSLVLILNQLNLELEKLKEEQVIIEEDKEWINRANAIMDIESNGNPLAVNWKDAQKRKDKTPSIGLYQFYWGTFVSFGHKYKVIPEWVNTYKEALPYMKNPIYNAAVAHGMLQEPEDLTFHWATTMKKINKLSN